MRKGILLAFSLLVCLAFNAYGQTDASRRISTLEKKASDLEREVTSLRDELAWYRIQPPPDSATLCNRPIPLSNEDVRERFEREFFQLQQDRGLLVILVKRYAKFLGVVSDEINRMNLPQDLIYLAITESYLNPRAVSKASAGGIWQFIKETGKMEGLFIDESVDERYSVIRSTRSALGHLKKLQAEFGDWLLAMAAYNAGKARLREAITNQNSRDFFEMYLPEETDRYIYRVVAIKELLTNPHKYGLFVDKKDYYKPFAVTEVTVEVRKDLHTAVLAQSMDLPYRAFREYNLHIRKYTLPKGTYYLYIPVEKKEIFLRRASENPAFIVHRGAEQRREE